MVSGTPIPPPTLSKICMPEKKKTHARNGHPIESINTGLIDALRTLSVATGTQGVNYLVGAPTRTIVAMRMSKKLCVTESMVSRMGEMYAKGGLKSFYPSPVAVFSWTLYCRVVSFFSKSAADSIGLGNFSGAVTVGAMESTARFVLAPLDLYKNRSLALGPTKASELWSKSRRYVHTGEFLKANYVGAAHNSSAVLLGAIPWWYAYNVWTNSLFPVQTDDSALKILANTSSRGVFASLTADLITHPLTVHAIQNQVRRTPKSFTGNIKGLVESGVSQGFLAASKRPSLTLGYIGIEIARRTHSGLGLKVASNVLPSMITSVALGYLERKNPSHQTDEIVY